MQKAEGEQCFFLHNGGVLRDALELHHALQDITEEQFRHHVGNGKNDFASWTRDVLGDHDLADAFLRSRTPMGHARAAKRILTRHGFIT